jgi:hemolysin III
MSFRSSSRKPVTRPVSDSSAFDDLQLSSVNPHFVDHEHKRRSTVSSSRHSKSSRHSQPRIHRGSNASRRSSIASSSENRYSSSSPLAHQSSTSPEQAKAALVKDGMNFIASGYNGTIDAFNVGKGYISSTLAISDEATAEVMETVEDKIGGRVMLATPGRLPHDGLLSRDHSPHVTDEVFNAASHFVGFLIFFLGSVLLIAAAAAQGDAYKVVSMVIYGLSVCSLFASSTLHHAIEGPDNLERVLLTMDYCAIFPLIAGTFTPMCLVVLKGTVVGWVFVSVLWILATAGMTMLILVASLTDDELPKWITTSMYVSMGWMAALLAPVIMSKIGVVGMVLLIGGGICYSAGGYVFTVEKPNPVPGVFGFHEIWHVAVLLGAMMHFLMMLLVVIPYKG